MTTLPATSAPADPLRQVRERLAEPSPRRSSPWPMLGAAVFAAGSGLALCIAVFMSAADLPSARPPPQAAPMILNVAHG